MAEIFTPQQLNIYTNGFSQVISNKGAFGIVYRGTRPDPANGNAAQSIVVKQSTSRDEIYHDMWQAERVYLPLCHNSPNVIRLIGYADDPMADKYYLIFPYYRRGSLSDNIAGLQWHQVVNILRGVATGIFHIHTCNVPPIIHGDLKSDNVLIDDEGNAIICDFGTAQEVGQQKRVGTFGYLDPWGGEVATCADIYSFGIIIFQLLRKSRTVIFGENNIRCLFEQETDVMKLVRGSLLDSGCSKTDATKIVSIASRCTEYDPENRPTIEAVLQELNELNTTRPSKLKKVLNRATRMLR